MPTKSNPCGRKIRNLGSLYALIHKETRKPEENPSREAEKVPAKSKDAEKRLFCECTPAEEWHIQHATQSTDLHVIMELNLNPVVIERSKEK